MMALGLQPCQWKLISFFNDKPIEEIMRLFYLVILLAFTSCNERSTSNSQSQTWSGQGQWKSFTIKNKKNDLCLDVVGNDGKSGDNVMLYECDRKADQRWSFRGEQIVNSKKGLCLDVEGSERQSLDNVMLYDCDHSSDQSWTLRDGQLVNKKNGLCLDVEGNDGRAGDNVMLYDCD